MTSFSPLLREGMSDFQKALSSDNFYFIFSIQARKKDWFCWLYGWIVGGKQASPLTKESKKFVKIPHAFTSCKYVGNISIKVCCHLGFCKTKIKIIWKWSQLALWPDSDVFMMRNFRLQIDDLNWMILINELKEIFLSFQSNRSSVRINQQTSFAIHKNQNKSYFNIRMPGY